MTAPSRGYLTLAARAPRYLEMAVDMALSLRRHTALPVALAADERIGVLAQTRYAGVFDHVTLVPRRFREGRALKFGAAEASPFEETIFVDADCFVLGPLDGLLDALAGSDMAMTGEVLTSADDRVHHGFSTRALMRRFELERYLKTNSGLFCFRRSAALGIMEECLRCHLGEVVPALRWETLIGRWIGDELAFGIVGGRRGIAPLPKPDAMYWPEEIAALDLERPEKPLLHLIAPPAPATLDALLAAAAARRREAGVRGDAEAHWREEARRVGRHARRWSLRRLLGRA
ncbi:MAG TPA: hypothetical protein VFQ22_07800 [Longimicrobiales bacterium]|nr:hypothetical protein [Longimicrobiales bacterium]